MINWSDFDRLMMRMALIEARRGLLTAKENPRVGCVIARAREILALGYHAVTGGPHAEINALSQVNDANGATCYVTLEPCSHEGKTGPCADALIEAGIIRVVCAMVDPNPQVSGKGIQRLKEAGIEVEVGLFEADSYALNPGFVKRMISGIPFVWIKNSVSFDGKTALASGESKWITSPESRSDIHNLRGRVGAIVTGVDTIIADDPRLNFRANELGFSSNATQPVRVVLDSKARLPNHGRLFDTEGTIIWVTRAPTPHTQLIANRVTQWVLPGEEDRIDLGKLLKCLGREGINEVLIEAGQTLSGAFVNLGLVDRGVTYFAPKLLGHDARNMYHMSPRRLADAPQIRIENIISVGPDLRLEWTLRTDY